MRIKQEDEYAYLMSKSLPYIVGWTAQSKGESASTSRKGLPTLEERQEFDQGYSDCYANGESEPETFDYVEGI